jgi:hypothetical protein
MGVNSSVFAELNHSQLVHSQSVRADRDFTGIRPFQQRPNVDNDGTLQFSIASLEILARIVTKSEWRTWKCSAAAAYQVV